MPPRRAVAVLSALAGAAALMALGAWILGEGSAVPATSPPPEGRDAPRGPGPAPAPRRAPWERKARPAPPRPAEAAEAGVPKAPRVPGVPPGAKPWARLRLLEAGTRLPVPWWKQAAVVGFESKAGYWPVYHPVRAAEDGCVEVFDATEPAPGRPIAGRWEVRVPGYEALGFETRASLEGDRELVLAPASPAARGVFGLGVGLERRGFRAEIRPVDGTRMAEGAPPPAILPSPPQPGPFEVYDAPPGDWWVGAWVPLPDGTTAHRAVRFTKSEDVVDLGSIEIRAPATVAARVVAKDGTPVLDKRMTIRKEGEEGEKASEGDPDISGWVYFRGLDADADYRVLSSLDGLEQAVHTPSEGLREARVELRWENQGVRCRLRFTVEGAEPVRWGDLFEGPTLDAGAWHKDGFLEHDMAPGEYLFGIWAQTAGKDALHRYWATFTVPNEPLWEKTIDLSAERK